MLLAEDSREIRGRAEDAHAVDAKVLLARIVVDEADRSGAERLGLQHLLDDHLRSVARAGDDHLLAARDDALRRRALEDRPGEHA